MPSELVVGVVEEETIKSVEVEIESVVDDIVLSVVEAMLSVDEVAYSAVEVATRDVATNPFQEKSMILFMVMTLLSSNP